MLIGQLSRRLNSFPRQSVIRASVADGAGTRSLRLRTTGHHTPPDDIGEGHTPFGVTRVEVDGRQQDEVHPVEIFADHRFDGASDADLKIGDLVPELVSYPDEAMVRVAVPGDGHHRLLEITGVGFSSAADEVGGELVVELTCERWDYGYPVVRTDQPLRE